MQIYQAPFEKKWNKQKLHILTLSLLLLAASPTVLAERWFGTAFAVGDGYTYVTNEHVINGARTICFLATSGAGGKARVLSSDRSDDLAILRGNLNLPPLNISRSTNVEKGMKIFALGYPVPSIMGLEAKVTEGIVNAVTGIQGDRRRFQVSAALQPGNSGGPLFDQYGNVVGVVVSGLGRRFTEATGHIPNTVGYGIHTARLKALVDTTPPLPQYVKYSNLQTQIPLPRLVSQVERSVVLVIASSEDRTCESDFDVPIPDFGVSAKSREQLQRERDEADRLARARAQREADIRTQREQALLKEEENRKRKEFEVVTAKRENIRRSLNSFRSDWRDIQSYIGFKFFMLNIVNKAFYDLEDASSATEAKELLQGYIRWATMNDNVDLLGVSKSELLYGRLFSSGKISLVNNDLNFFVVDFLDINYTRDKIVIISPDASSFQVFTPSRNSGLRSSFVLDRNSSFVKLGGVVFSVKN